MAQLSTIGKVATTVRTNEQGCTQVTYHNTVVVAFTGKAIVLNNGGWMTNTTKTRMNQTSHQFNLGYQVHQRDWNWYVTFKGEELPFTGRIIELTR